ncbi:MAG: 30S ribosomal protein S2 [candidate division WOR-3 bacterium]
MVSPNAGELINTPNVNINIEELLQNGVHFGHRVYRWNPKMKEYIYGKKEGIHIINIHKTLQKLKEALEFVEKKGSEGAIPLFVCTKKQGKEIVKEYATKAGVYYVVERWPGGLLTNFETIKTRIEKMREIEKMKEDGRLEKYPKNEKQKILKVYEKLHKNLGGVKDMFELPQFLFIIDPVKEELAVKEAKKLNIPIVALIDTDGNPEIIDYPIPGNDDAMKSIEYITRLITDAYLRGKAKLKEEE